MPVNIVNLIFLCQRSWQFEKQVMFFSYSFRFHIDLNALTFDSQYWGAMRL